MTTIFLLCLLSQNPLAPPESVLVAAPPVAPANPPAASPVTPPAPVAPTPELWDLKDTRGQVWRHADREYLKAWVAGRNSVLEKIQDTRLPAQTQYQVQTQTPGQTQGYYCDQGHFHAGNAVAVTTGAPTVPYGRWTPYGQSAAYFQGGSCYVNSAGQMVCGR